MDGGRLECGAASCVMYRDTGSPQRTTHFRDICSRNSRRVLNDLFFYLIKQILILSGMFVAIRTESAADGRLQSSCTEVGPGAARKPSCILVGQFRRLLQWYVKRPSANLHAR